MEGDSRKALGLQGFCADIRIIILGHRVNQTISHKSGHDAYACSIPYQQLILLSGLPNP